MTEPKQEIRRCLVCNSELVYSGSGRRPRYCSSACRHRAWEIRRAADAGLVDRQAVEMPTVTVEKERPYSRSGVADWLMEHPDRMANVLQELPNSEQVVTALKLAILRIQGNLKVESMGWKSENATPPVLEVEELSGVVDPDSPELALKDSNLTVVAYNDRKFILPAGMSRQKRRAWLKKNAG